MHIKHSQLFSLCPTQPLDSLDENHKVNDTKTTCTLLHSLFDGGWGGGKSNDYISYTLNSVMAKIYSVSGNRVPPKSEPFLTTVISSEVEEV